MHDIRAEFGERAVDGRRWHADGQRIDERQANRRHAHDPETRVVGDFWMVGTLLSGPLPCGPGAITMASWPCAFRYSRMRRTELLTPFTCGKKIRRRWLRAAAIGPKVQTTTSITRDYLSWEFLVRSSAFGGAALWDASRS